MAGYLGLAQAMINGPEYDKAKPFSITLMSPKAVWFEPPQTREFPWPEELSISREANYASTQVPGGTGSVHQWTGTTGNSFPLTFKLFRDIRPRQDLPLLTSVVVDPLSPENRKYNRDIIADFQFFDQLVLPRYEVSSSGTRPSPPRVGLFTFGGLEVFYGGRDYCICIVKSLEKQIQRVFPNGEPRVATVTLSVEETIFDEGWNILMHDRAYALSRFMER